MLIRGILAILALVTLTLLVLAFYFDNSTLGLIAFPFLILLALVFTFKPQIDWWYFSKNTPDLDEPIVKVFENQLPAYYQQKSKEQKLAFRQKTFMCQLGIDWKIQERELGQAPADLSALLASQIARVTPEKDQYLLGNFENIILYHHPFPSPNHPKTWHSSELFEEDGVMLFSLELAIPGIVTPQQHFNIVLYEVIKAANFSGLINLKQNLPDWKTCIKDITGQKAEWVEKAVGLPDLDNSAIHKVLEMEFQERYNITIPI